MELNMNELVDYVYEKTGGLTITKEILHTIFDLEYDFMVEKGIVVEETEGLGDSLG